MDLIKKIRHIGLGLFLFGAVFISFDVQAYNLSAIDVYRQAYYKNQRFMNWLANYGRAIDVQNRLGDTAYCIALQYNDTETQKMLQSYGANINHDCVKRFRQNYGRQGVDNTPVLQTDRYPTRSSSMSISAEHNYLWWGLGALAAGGGIAAIASSGGGGSHHSHGSNNESSNQSGNNISDQGGSGDNQDDGSDQDSSGDVGDNQDDGSDQDSSGDVGDNQDDGSDQDSSGDVGDNQDDGSDQDSSGDVGDNQDDGSDQDSSGDVGDNQDDDSDQDSSGDVGDNQDDGSDQDSSGDVGDNQDDDSEQGGSDDTGDNKDDGSDQDSSGDTGDNQDDDSDQSNSGDVGDNQDDDSEQGSSGDTGDNQDDNTSTDEGNGGGDIADGGGSAGNEGNDGLTNLSAAAFKTGEFNRGNFLNGINAASAYSAIYRQDANGNLVSHQKTSDDALRKIIVGVIDTGVFAHDDLDDKIVGSYDANMYKGEGKGGNVWGYARGNIHYYIFYKNGKYHFMAINVASEQLSVTPYAKLDKADLDALLKGYSLTFTNFTLMNDNVSGGPGVSMADFDPNIDIDASRVATWWNLVTELSHGTHVAGIIAANKNDGGMHGVAFDNAEIYAGSWDFEQSLYPMVEDMINNGVKVFNNSWGMEATNYRNASKPEWLLANDPDFLKSYAYAAKNGAVWVQATGNEGRIEAGVQAGVGQLNNQLSAYEYDGPANEYEVPFIAVAALDPSTAIEGAESGRIASYSNWCGSAKEYCLTAPGTNITSTIPIKNGYLTMDGTSMATPVVSGSIALMLGYYPYLKPQHVAWLLLETANRKGEYADSDIYGKGVLDLERAAQPVGDLVLPTKSGFNDMKAAANSKLLLGSVAQSKFKNSLPKTVTAFDVLNRPFEYETSKLVSATHASNANFRNEVSHAAISKPSRVIKDEKSGFTFSSQESLAKNGQEHLSEVSVVHETDKGSTRFYYAENSQYTNAESAVKPTSNPYMAMNEAYGAEHTLNLSDVSRLKLSLQTGENGLYGRDYEQDHQSFDERAYGMGAEYSFDLTDYLELSAIGGLLYEEDAMLGMNGRGGFAIKDGSTYYGGIKAMFNVTPNFTILAAYYRGYTEGRDTSLMSMSNLETESYMIAGEYKLDEENKLGLSLRSPMSVVKGKSSFRYASGRDNYSDTIYMRKLTSSLKPAAKEYDLGMYYIGEPKEDLNITGKIEARFNADGEKGVTDYLGIMGISKSF